jgi:hypothetical protein
MANQWVDFKAVKEAVSMQMVIEHYGIKGLRKSKDELRGACPFPGGTNSNKRAFSVNLSKNVFKCFVCGSRGNVLDFVAAMDSCSVREAALKLAEWFGVGESESVESEEHLDEVIETIEMGVYRHFKGGDYLVTGVAVHSETGELLVIYRPLYGDYQLTARPLKMFTETVERDGDSVPRFHLVREL